MQQQQQQQQRQQQQVVGRNGLTEEQMARHAQRQAELGLDKLKEDIELNGPTNGCPPAEEIINNGIKMTREEMVEQGFYPKPMEDYGEEKNQ